uniref:Uncharacterized protein n=1 Tax=Oryza sativa subsp. japonica TaxID=39947 RepID=Q6ERR7_ORYSJ|nr:hypothetical protein [Oryza sativa Japonica Group]
MRRRVLGTCGVGCRRTTPRALGGGRPCEWTRMRHCGVGREQRWRRGRERPKHARDRMPVPAGRLAADLAGCSCCQSGCGAASPHRAKPLLRPASARAVLLLHVETP